MKKLRHQLATFQALQKRSAAATATRTPQLQRLRLSESFSNFFDNKNADKNLGPRAGTTSTAAAATAATKAKIKVQHKARVAEHEKAAAEKRTGDEIEKVEKERKTAKHKARIAEQEKAGAEKKAGAKWERAEKEGKAAKRLASR